MARLVMVTGSMAAGKSTVAEVVVQRLRERGFSGALTALDQSPDELASEVLTTIGARIETRR